MFSRCFSQKLNRQYSGLHFRVRIDTTVNVKRIPERVSGGHLVGCAYNVISTRIEKGGGGAETHKTLAPEKHTVMLKNTQLHREAKTLHKSGYDRAYLKHPAHYVG